MATAFPSPYMEATLSHPRQRASQACVMCHSRKVKCDALKVYPCTRCKDANLSCTLRTSNRGRSRRQNTKNPSTTASSEAPPIQPNDAQTFWSVVGSDGTSSVQDGTSPTSVQDDENTSNGAKRIRMEVESLDKPPQNAVDEDGAPILHLGENGALTYLLGVVASEDGGGSSVGNFHVQLDSLVSVPIASRYKEAFSRHDKLTSAFLSSKGLLVFPPPKVTDHIINLYFSYVDPHMPLLNRSDFMHKYRTRQVSPLLLQSVLFVASHYVDDQTVAATRWTSKREMTSSFFDKARILADYELENDQMTLVQSFVLLAHRWEHWTQDRGPRYWISRAVNIAVAMGMHRRPQALNLQKPRERLWKRVWSVVLARDRFVAAAVGAPVLVNEHCIDQRPGLKDDDFNEYSWDVNPNEILPRSQESIRYSIDFLALGVLLGEIVERQYSARTSPDGNTSSQNIEMQLEVYNRSTPDLSKFCTTPGQASNAPRELRVFAPLIRAAYLLVYIFYHRPLAEKHPDPGLRQQHRRTFFSAAHEICELVQYLCNEGLMPLCPLWFVTCIFHTLGVLLAEYQEYLIASPNPLDGSASQPIHILIEALRILEGTWHMAGWGLGLFMKALERLQEKARARTDANSRAPAHEPVDQVPMQNTQMYQAPMAGSQDMFGFTDMLEWGDMNSYFWPQWNG